MGEQHPVVPALTAASGERAAESGQPIRGFGGRGFAASWHRRVERRGPVERPLAAHHRKRGLREREYDGSITVERGDLVKVVSAPGQIEPKTNVEISAQVSARIVALPFREGDTDGDYDHLARVLEWSAGADEAGGGEGEA